MSNNPQHDTSQLEEQISALLSGFQPKPRQAFYQRMSTAPWKKMNHSRSSYYNNVNKVMRLVTFTILSLLLILVPLFLTPSLRSNARQLLRFFWVNNENSRFIEVTYTPTSTSESPLPESAFPLSLEEAATNAGFQLKTLTALPTGVTLDGAAYDPLRNAVLIRYAGERKIILFTQHEDDHIHEYASVGPDATAEIVKVRGVQGEFIPGGWLVQKKSTPQPGLESQTIELIWENQAGMATLRWEENGYLYEIVVTSPQNISRAELLAIAESMR